MVQVNHTTLPTGTRLPASIPPPDAMPEGLDPDAHRTARAYHEAGHAVADHAYGRPIGFALVEDGGSGIVQPMPGVVPEELWTPEMFDAHAIGLLSGRIAECFWFGVDGATTDLGFDADVFAYGRDEGDSIGDGDLYVHALGKLGTPPTETEIDDRALDARPAHSEPAYELIQSRWPAVDVLAMELLGTPGGLSGEAISAIIEAAGFEPLADLWMERRAELADDG